MSAVSPHSCCWHSRGKKPWKQLQPPTWGTWVGEAKHGEDQEAQSMLRLQQNVLRTSPLHCQASARLWAKPPDGHCSSCAMRGDITCILSAHLHVTLLAGNTAYIQARYHTHILLSWDVGNVGTKALDGWPRSEMASGAGVLAHTSARPRERVASFLHTSAYSHCVLLLVVRLCSLTQKSTKINGNTSTSVTGETFLRNVFYSFNNVFIQSLKLHNRMTDRNEQVWATVENIGKHCSWQNQRIKDKV